MNNNFRRILCVLMTMMLAAFALPSFGQTQNKHFALGVVPGTPDNNHLSSVVYVTIYNDNPSGSSASAGSFTLTVAGTNGVTINGWDPQSDGLVHFGGVVTLSQSKKSITVTNINPLKATQAYTLALYMGGCGDINPWSALVWSGSNLNGGTLINDGKGKQDTDISCGLVACGGGLVGVNGVTQGLRGLYNLDGSLCGNSNYFVTNNLATGVPVPNLYFEYDVGNAVFSYFVSPNPPVTKLGWVLDGSGNPILITGLQCDQSNSNISPPGLPAPYGTLLQDNGGNKIKVDTSTKVYNLPTTIPADGIPLMVEKEMMLLTNMVGQQWTVTRGVGNTQAKRHNPNDNLFVLSVPFPIIPNVAPWNGYSSPSLYAPGNYARACFPAGPGDSSGGIVDTSDGWSSP